MKKRLENLNLSEEELDDFLEEVSFILKDGVLTPEKIQYITKECLYSEELEEHELPEECIFINGITSKFIFNPSKIKVYKLAIETMLNEIHPISQQSIDSNFTKNNILWTGDQFIMESFIALGMAIGNIYYCTNDHYIWTIFLSSLK